jgi:hypothetical protein
MRVENLIAQRLTKFRLSPVTSFMILRKLYAANVKPIYKVLLDPLKIDHVATFLNKIHKMIELQALKDNCSEALKVYINNPQLIAIDKLLKLKGGVPAIQLKKCNKEVETFIKGKEGIEQLLERSTKWK